MRQVLAVALLTCAAALSAPNKERTSRVLLNSNGEEEAETYNRLEVSSRSIESTAQTTAKLTRRSVGVSMDAAASMDAAGAAWPFTHSDTNACPVAQSTEHDYKYVKAVVEILDSIGQPYFITGGSGMALLRFGAVSIHPDPKSSKPFALDNDLDFFVLSKDDSERQDFCSKFDSKCREAGLFKRCGGCSTKWSSSGTSMVVPGKEGVDPDAAFFDLRESGSGKLKVTGWSRPWTLDRDIVLPARKAKYYDIAIPVAAKPLEFYSHCIPWHPEQPNPEYGSGCDGMAYPTWLTSTSPWGQKGAHGERQAPGLNIPRNVLEQCAKALDSAGFASFSECFNPA